MQQTVDYVIATTITLDVTPEEARILARWIDALERVARTARAVLEAGVLADCEWEELVDALGELDKTKGASEGDGREH
jgi:hypothetical protein